MSEANSGVIAINITIKDLIKQWQQINLIFNNSDLYATVKLMWMHNVSRKKYLNICCEHFIMEFPLPLPHLVEFTYQIISVWKNPSLLQMVNTEIYINVQMYVYMKHSQFYLNH